MLAWLILDWVVFFEWQFQYSPQHLVRLLQIIVDNNCDMGVRQVGSIHFKNFIAKNWSPHEPGTLCLACGRFSVSIRWQISISNLIILGLM
jgi:hypothetical protein